VDPVMRTFRRALIAAALVGASGFLPGAAVQTTVSASQARAVQIVTSPDTGTVGSRIAFSAAGLTSGSSVDLSWETVQGGWVTRDYYHFDGKAYEKSNVALGQYQVGDDGFLEGEFDIPEDYGGMHNVVASIDGMPVAQGAVDVAASFDMTPLDGPIGTPIEIRATGLGWQTMDSVWVLNWDNAEVGWISAADTRGSAVARFRAGGPPGDHQIKVYSGYMGQSYLNYEQAPTAYLTRPSFVFHTTPGGLLPGGFVEPYPRQQRPDASGPIGSTLQLSPSQGPVQTQVQLVGSGFPAGSTVALFWQTMVGNRVSDTGFAPKDSLLANVDVDNHGGLTAPITIPDDLGGLHAIVVRDGDQELARTYFSIETSIVGMTPVAGPVGTIITIHLKGVGWTEYDNILVADYDNAYMGYACGFNSQGDVEFQFTAAGTPGTHLIDLYPGIYKGPPEGQQLYRLPQLTYADDHPGNKIPALRFALTITP
jgi:hypothetical protein